MAKKKILIIEDEPNLVELLKFRLEVNNYDVITALDGELGLEMAKNQAPDLIILDLMVPKIDGYKICETLKNDPEYSKISILVLSAKTQDEEIKRGKEAGADFYMTKPFDPQKLLTQIRNLLENRG